jgi:signal transduction histidine kinase/HD-like signal output (HDOD) protein
MNQPEKIIDKSVKILSAVKSEDERVKIDGFLASRGISSVSVSSGLKALEIASENNFPVIFIDSLIDDISLKDLPGKINSSAKNHKAVFSILLNRDNSGLIPELKKHGYEDFIIKPLDKNIFISRVETLLKLNRIENTLARAVKYIQAEGKSSTDLKNISQDIIIQWGRLETLGRLTSGVMHEITTPVQYVTDNMNFLGESFPVLIDAVNSFSKFIEDVKNGKAHELSIKKAEEAVKNPDLEYLKNEIPQAVDQSMGGIEKITNILLSVRSMSRQIINETVSSDINRIVENAVIITKSIWKNFAELETELNDNLPPVQCQPGAISQVIVNLIVNAAHAVEERTEVKNHLIKVETGLENNMVVIRVSDTGKGIPEQFIPRIFNPFFTTKKIEKGTGQGLAISKTIIERHKGNIYVSSKPDSGTVFTVTLPVTPEELKTEHKKEQKKPILESKPDEKPLILFVDEDRDMLKSLQRMLKSNENEWETHFSDSAQKALSFMEKTPVDIIVTEYNMKETGGHELLKEVKKKFPQTDRVLLSGETDEEKIMKTVSIAHQFIYKPVSASKLRSMIKRTIAMRSILKDRNLRRTVSKLDSLPSLPSIYNEIVKELNSPVSSTKKVGEIISRDPSMTSKILQLINSGFFYLPSKISKPDEAVVLLGMDIVKSLVLNLEIFSKLKLQKHFLDFQKKLHLHSMAAAKTAKEIAVMEGLSDFQADQAFMAGLIHDCGKLVLASNFPEEYKQVLDKILNNNSDFITEETEIFKSSHEIIGAFLMGVWGLPLEIIEAILYHHNPSKSSDTEFGVTAAVHAANIIECEKAGTLHIPYEEAFDNKFFERIKVYKRPEIWREKFLK